MDHVCERCTKSFKTTQALTRHMERKRPCVEVMKPIVTHGENITVNIKGISLDDLKKLLGNNIMVEEVKPVENKSSLEDMVKQLLDRVTKLEQKEVAPVLPVVQPINEVVESSCDEVKPVPEPEPEPEPVKPVIKIRKRRKAVREEKVEEDFEEVTLEALAKEAHEINDTINDNRDVAESIVGAKNHETAETKKLARQNKELSLKLIKVKRELRARGYDMKTLNLKVRAVDKLDD